MKVRGGGIQSNQSNNETQIPERFCLIWRGLRVCFGGNIPSLFLSFVHSAHAHCDDGDRLIDVIVVYLNESCGALCFPGGPRGSDGKIQTDGGQDDDAVDDEESVEVHHRLLMLLTIHSRPWYNLRERETHITINLSSHGVFRRNRIRERNPRI